MKVFSVLLAILPCVPRVKGEGRRQSVRRLRARSGHMHRVSLLLLPSTKLPVPGTPPTPSPTTIITTTAAASMIDISIIIIFIIINNPGPGNEAS